ncbi:protein of unknown function [Methylocaldum szegediense]|uniref:Uncharacterized protein n=1 Tax=Methylocaldum szegediense TaxID=73780 RepID=A0ABM9I5Y1_9GAMM|nr:protein of unknown function [Methylocaldum szegediense]
MDVQGCRIRIVERVMGIEPTLQAWEARVLPLNYTRPIPSEMDAFLPEGMHPSPRGLVDRPISR